MAGGNIKRDNWGGGAHNRNTADRLPDTFYRHAVNLDPVGGGKLNLRAGYLKRYTGTAVRGALALGEKVLIADGTNLVEFDTRTNSSRVLRSIVGAGDLVGDRHNNELYFCTANESLRYDGNGVRAWGVPSMPSQPPVAVANGGGLIQGTFAYAATFTDADGFEGGTGPSEAFLSAGGEKAIFVLPQPPTGGKVRLYIGRADSTTLYFQHEQQAAGSVEITGLRDDSATLETQFYTEPPQGHLIASSRASLLIAVENVIWMTSPLRTHLVRCARDFFQYPKRIAVMAPVAGGVFVVADKTYFLTGAGADIRQTVLDGATAVAGSQATLPDERVAWMSQYGPVIGNADGSLTFTSKDNYVPDTASQGRSGVLERNGNQLLITTHRGIPSRNGLGMGDFVSGMEIIAP